VVTFERSMTIDQPIESVFDYVADPLHFVPIWPGLTEIKHVQSLPTSSYRFDYVYFLAGMRFEGMGEFVEFVPKTHIACKLTGDIEGTLTFKFEAAVLATTVFFTVAYTVPMALLGKLPEVTFTELSVHEIDCLLANLKTVIPFFAPTAALR
jgi:carbon monoxide dehydrogenase subunit G